jgi:hypothetical protein
LTLATLALAVVVLSFVVLTEQPPPRLPVAEAASIVTRPEDAPNCHNAAICPELGSAPVAEEGEGGPDSVSLEPWAVSSPDCAEVRLLLERHEVERAELERLVWIAEQESSCGARRVNRASGDYGLWQVNWPTWGAPLCKRAGLCLTPWELAHDDEAQLSATLKILEWQGWGAWCWASSAHIARGVGYSCPWN